MLAIRVHLLSRISHDGFACKGHCPITPLMAHELLTHTHIHAQLPSLPLALHLPISPSPFSSLSPSLPLSLLLALSLSLC